MQPEAVIFDIGNVLTRWQPEAFYDRVIGEDRRRALFAAVDLHAMNEIVDAGGLFRETIYGWADRHPAWAPEVRMWYDRWIELASPRIEGSIALLRALRGKGVPVFSLTNFGSYSYEEARGKLDFLSEFDREYVSGRMGVTKPDPRIYAMVEEDCGVAPGRLLFADDRADNITAAARRGWRTHQFESWQGWAARLVAEGLLTTGEAGL
ncbi:MAG: HAD family phosphatase [Tabrizicola sp.]|uniref:HAD family hydrolase n=1 Tax=Tabrizicola sp. TaxID=2005166 RepID=UPI0027337A53|nr:HAD family phosphatase [Tabrizicola sp.]MDP3262111.1 HAD family phosphatase [Tabrizicola sp.]MDP3648143.1 HAD family phosphatase [Paracoccaceae bacterium]MDZ4066064.1 HAD family phosphatase [Tabrizicola sp.]